MADRNDIAKLYVATFNRAADANGLAYWISDGTPNTTGLTNLEDIAAAMLESDEASALYAGMDRESMVKEMYVNLFGRQADDAGLAYWTTGGGSSIPENKMIIALINGAYGDDARVLENKTTVGLEYADAGLNGYFSLAAVTADSESMNIPIQQISQLREEALAEQANLAINGTTVVKGDSVLDVGVMRLTGTQDVRIDLTDKEDQLEGVDLNNNGTIDTDGVENNSPIKVSNITVVDAYARNPLNTSDTENNFFGDIEFDGTGYQGDGVSTDGNIFLGGLGSDVAFGGIGNDFMTGGQSGGDVLNGGRNADFFFVELSALDTVNGDSLRIDGGSTFDNSASQDTDWLLLEASDDDEPVTINLNDNDAVNVVYDVTARSGTGFDMDDVENVNASGNLYGFVNSLDVKLGDNGQTINGENVAIGSTAQLIVNGSDSANIIIGGYDNDTIDGNDGNDIIFGGDMQFNKTYHNNPNILDITNDGADSITGGAGSDDIMFEMDGGIIEGGATVNVDDNESDTLWLTDYTGGTKDSTDDKLVDNVVRIDLGVGKQGGTDNYAGYGGADSNANGLGSSYTADQSNYVNGVSRVQVQDMESVIATGLGAIDYDIDGANAGELDSTVQNYHGINSDLDLRGTNGVNTLYANKGDDVIEGRDGDDMLSGGEGNDRFLFDLVNGDGKDIIHRQTDIGNNITDGTFGQDFGVDSNSQFGPSSLSVSFAGANLSDPNVHMGSFSVVIGGVTFAVTDLNALAAATSTAEVAAVADAAFKAIDPNVSVSASGDILTITDATPTGGRDISDTQAEGYAVDITVVAPGSGALGLPTYTAPGETISQDQLEFIAYQDRADNERVDDDANFGGDSLGANAYAQDLVLGFNKDGNTIISEGQSFDVKFTNLSVQDSVTVQVNGVEYSLTVGKALNGDLIPAETNNAFVARLANFINNFMDDDTAAGKVSASALTDTMTLTQATYAGEETVFMDVSVDVSDNSSLGEPASAVVTNNSSTEINLYKFDGSNNALNADNVLFLGDSGESRSVLATAKDAGGDLLGSDAIVVNVDTDTNVTDSANESVSGDKIYFNPTANLTTGRTNNFAIHGDDQLFGGSGNDVIKAGTGDDRVYGSYGTDTIDGGKDLYLVDGVIRVLNAYEAAQVDADPAVLDISLVGHGLNTGELSSTYDDTLIYQQSDFGTVGAGGAKFNIKLDLSANQANGGAGKVVVDDSAANTTLFTNIEHIRTVSGNGTLAGQGDDTIDLSVSVDPLTGAETANGADMVYDLTAAATAGDVTLNGTVVSKVDGVENVKFGSGDDTLLIDQTEAGKHNSVEGGSGDDTVNYAFNINGDNTFNPAVTLTVNSATDTDTVSMTGGFVGNDVPVDTLVNIETINFSDTLDNPTLSDTLDVTHVNNAVVDFVNGRVTDGNGNVQVNIGNMQNFEVVNADYSDTVIVSDSMANSKASGTDSDILFDSFLNYDIVDANNVRQSVADLRASGSALPQVENAGLYTFNMGPDSDKVDYSNETGTIVAVANFTSSSNITVNNVLVSNDGDIDFADNSNRIDAITNAENLVASSGNSIIDLTSATGDLKVRFNADDGVTEHVAALDRDVYRIQLSELNTTSPIQGMNFLSYEDAGTSALVTQVAADWNTIEGSDHAIMVELTDHETTANNTFNLRGGDNEVNYNELTRSISSVISLNGTTDIITVTNTFTDGNGVVIGGTDTVTVNSAQNAIAAGSLRIEASQDAEDSFTIAGTDTKTFLLGEVVNGSDQVTVTFGDSANQNSMVLTGYEFITDAATDDTYTMTDMNRVLNQLTFTDNALNDIDTIEVGNDAVAFNGGNAAFTAPASTISLEVINDAFGMDFDILDMTTVTTSGLTVMGDDDDQNNDLTLNIADATFVHPDGSVGNAASARDIANDTVVLGNLSLVNDVQLFDTLAVTDASGSYFDLDMTAGALQDASNVNYFTFDVDVDTLDASRTTTGVTMTVTGAGNVSVIGGTGSDTITGGSGNNTITGGLGADTLDGNFTPAVGEVQTVDLGVGNLVDDDIISIGGVTLATSVDTDGSDIVLGAATVDEDMIGQGFADYTNANWETALGLNPGDIVSVDYDAITNKISFNFSVQAGNVAAITSSLTDSTAADGIDPGTTIAVPVVTDDAVAYAAQVDTADTFVYLTTADSTQVSTDTIANFDDSDVINFTALDLATLTGNGISAEAAIKNHNVIADFNAALSAIASNFFDDSGTDRAVGVVSDGTDARVYVDVNGNGDLDAADMQINLTGLATTTNIDSVGDFVF